MSGKGSARRPAAHVSRCTSFRHFWRPGRKRCLCGKQSHPAPRYGVKVCRPDITAVHPPVEACSIRGGHDVKRCGILTKQGV